jgi:tetratricopeptide (TPR) repeat protein
MNRANILSIWFFFLLTNILNAQNDTIFDKDTIQINRIIRLGIADFEKYLNIIAEPENTDVGDFIEVMVSPGKGLFIDKSSARIENDLIPGSDQNDNLASNLSFEDYLRTFFTTYGKSEEQTITLIPEQILPLQKATKNFYCSVIVLSIFSGKDVNGGKYNPVKRIYDYICVKENSRWRCLITAIRFLKPSDKQVDSTKSVKIFKSNESIEIILDRLKQEEQYEIKREQIRINSELDKIRLLLEDKQYRKAFDEASKTRILYPLNEQIEIIYDSTLAKLSRFREKEKEENARRKIIQTIVDSIYLVHHLYRFELMKPLFERLSFYGFPNERIKPDVLSDYKHFLQIHTQCEEYLKKADMQKATNTLNEFFETYKLNNDSNLLSYIYFKKATIVISQGSNKKKVIAEASDFLTKSISYSSLRNQNALLLRSSLHTLSNDFPKAASDISIYLANESNNPHVFFDAAKIYLLDSINGFIRVEKALELLSYAIKLSSIDTNCYLLKSKLEVSQKDFGLAIKTLEDAIDRGLSVPSIIFRKGVIHYNLKQYNECGVHFQELLKRPSLTNDIKKGIKNLSHVQFIKADSLSALKHFVLAEERYKIAIDLDSNDAALIKLGILYYIDRKRHDESLKYLMVYSQRNDEKPHANFYIGKNYYDMMSYNKALYFFNRELERNPKSIPSKYYLGYSYLNLKNFEQAKSFFEECFKEDKSDSTSLAMARVYHAQSDFNKSLNYSIRGLKYNSKNTFINQLAGENCLKIGNYNKAINFLKMSLSNEVCVDSSLYSLFLIYYTQKNWDELIKTANQLLLITRKDKEVLNMLSLATILSPDPGFAKRVVEIVPLKISVLPSTVYCIFDFNVKWADLKTGRFFTADSGSLSEENKFCLLKVAYENLNSDPKKSAEILNQNFPAGTMIHDAIRKHPVFKTLRKKDLI